MHFTLRLYAVSLDAVRLVGPAATAIGRHDADLARQLRKALTSIHLNISEGMDAHGRNRHAHFRIALGSTNECIGALDAADALGYFTADAATHDKLQHVRATLLRLVVNRR
jgi:four helix bundle protein